MRTQSTMKILAPIKRLARSLAPLSPAFLFLDFPFPVPWSLSLRSLVPLVPRSLFFTHPPTLQHPTPPINSDPTPHAVL